MKTNILHLLTFAILIQATYAKGFFVESAKILLQITGTTASILLPMIPTFTGVIPRLAKTNLPLSSRYSQLRNLTEQEEQFYRTYIAPDIDIVCTPQKNNHAASCKNTIIMPELICTQNGESTLTEALEKNNVNVQQIFAGIAEHESGHIKKSHTLKSSLVCIAATSILTGLTALCTSKMIPLTLSDSVVRHLGWCSLKIGGSVLALAFNGYALTRIFKTIGRAQEFEADQYITNANKKAVMEWLAWSENHDYMSRVKKEYSQLSEEEQQSKIIELKEKDYASLTCVHPTPQERHNALLAA